MNLSQFFRSDSKVLRGNFLILTLSWLIMYSAGPIPQTYASLYYLSLGADEFILSLIGFAGSIAIALVQLPGGYLADKHGRRWLVSTMTYGLAVGAFFFIIAPSWPFIMLGMVIQSVCAIYGPALMAMVIDSLPPKHRGAGFSFQSIATSLAILPAPIIAQYLVLTFDFNLGMRLAYTIVMIAYFATATLRLKLKETLPSTDSEGPPRIVEALREYPKAVKESINVWRKLSKSAFYLFLASIGINGIVVGCYTYFVVYATSVLQITESQWAFVIAFMYLSVALPGIVAGLFMDIKGRKIFLILGYLLYAPGMLLFLTADFNMLLLAFFFYGLGNTLQMNSYQVLMGDMIPKKLRGTANGCIHFFLYLVQAILQITIGFIYAFVSPQLPFLLLAAAAIPFAAIIAFKVSEPEDKEA